MAKTNWQDPKSSEIISPHISGLQEAVGKLEESLGISSTAETGIALSEVYISESDRYRIYQAPEGKRNWLSSPTPIIKKNGVQITTGFIIEYGGGAIVFTTPLISTDVVTADATYTVKEATSLRQQIDNLVGEVGGHMENFATFAHTIKNYNNGFDVSQHTIPINSIFKVEKKGVGGGAWDTIIKENDAVSGSYLIFLRIGSSDRTQTQIVAHWRFRTSNVLTVLSGDETLIQTIKNGSVVELQVKSPSTTYGAYYSGVVIRTQVELS